MTDEFVWGKHSPTPQDEAFKRALATRIGEMRAAFLHRYGPDATPEVRENADGSWTLVPAVRGARTPVATVRPAADHVLRAETEAPSQRFMLASGSHMTSDLAREILALREAVRGVLPDLMDDRYETADVNPEFAAYRARVDRLRAILPENHAGKHP